MNPPRLLAPMAVAALLAVLSGCAGPAAVRPEAPVLAEKAEREIPAERLLNVNIAVFDPNLPAGAATGGDAQAVPAVRQAEANYLAYNLRSTLEQTGQWGAVRVVPEDIDSSELRVRGEIVASDGLSLELKVHAEDATGRPWLDKTYVQHVAAQSYRDPTDPADPFQSLYNQVANDLLAQRRKLSGEQVGEVRRVADLRFAAGVAPEAFGHYLEERRGRYRAIGLPARDDPMVERMQRIRERDDLLIDSLDQHYRLFHDGIDPAYSDWRAASFQESVELQEMQRQARTRKALGAAAVIAGLIGLANSDNSAEATGSEIAVIGGAYLFKTGIDKGREAQIHVQALQELGNSLGGDLEPKVIELEGRTVTLQGSAQAQYREWRQLLRQMHAADTGLAGG